MKFNALIIGVLVILIGAGAYWYFFMGTGNQPALSADTSASPDQTQTQFQTLASELGSISFDTSIFSDARFNALADLTTPISPESTGRLDPFAQVSNSGIRPVSTSTASSTTKIIKPK